MMIIGEIIIACAPNIILKLLMILLILLIQQKSNKNNYCIQSFSVINHVKAPVKIS